MPTVAVCQIGTTPLDPEGNRTRLSELCIQAAADGAEIIVLPELAASGYVLDGQALLAVAEPLGGPSTQTMSSVALSHDVVIVFGFAERVGEQLFNSAAVVGTDGGVASHYRKLHLFGGEKACFTPGDLGLPIAETAYGRIATCICYDLRFPEVMRLAALRGAELLAVPTAWIGGFDGADAGASPVCPQAQGAMLQANLDQIFVACASQSGQPGEFAFLGNSLICDPYGRALVGPLDRTGDASLLATVDWAMIAQAQARSALITPRADRRTDVYSIRYEGHDL